MKIVTYVCNRCGIELEKGHRTCKDCFEKNRLETAKEYYIKNKKKISIKSKKRWEKIKNCPKLHRKIINQINQWREKNKEKLRIKQREHYQNKEKIERVKYKNEVQDEIYNKVKHEVLKL
jgi:hypothetical protein